VLPGENPPVGLILCAEKDSAVARYALEGLPNKVLAAEYRLVPWFAATSRQPRCLNVAPAPVWASSPLTRNVVASRTTQTTAPGTWPRSWPGRGGCWNREGRRAKAAARRCSPRAAARANAASSSPARASPAAETPCASISLTNLRRRRSRSTGVPPVCIAGIPEGARWACPRVARASRPHRNSACNGLQPVPSPLVLLSRNVALRGNPWTTDGKAVAFVPRGCKVFSGRSCPGIGENPCTFSRPRRRAG
jgi:hypothetical protein